MLLSPPLTRNCPEPPPETCSGPTGTEPFGFDLLSPPFGLEDCDWPEPPSPPASSFPSPEALVVVEPESEPEPPQEERRPAKASSAAAASTAAIRDPHLLTQRLYCPGSGVPSRPYAVDTPEYRNRHRLPRVLQFSEVATGRRTPKLNERLPRGRHGLPRETVTESQRNRILQAMIDVVSERGYPETHVIGVAGVSRKTFYELFSSKEDCFLAAYDVLLGNLLGDTARGFESKPGSSWAERVAAGLGELLKHLAEHPDEARFAIVEVLAAGPKALARRDAALRQFTGFLDAGRAETSVELPGITSLSLAGGINELLYTEILHGAASQLPSRLPDLMFWITLPFLGPEGAAKERERTRLSMLES